VGVSLAAHPWLLDAARSSRYAVGYAEPCPTGQGNACAARETPTLSELANQLTSAPVADREPPIAGCRVAPARCHAGAPSEPGERAFPAPRLRQAPRALRVLAPASL
jgi:hypothetical protein